MLHRFRRPKVVVATALAVAVMAAPSAVLAIHQFSDVPDSYAFHDEIDAIATAGITTGFNDGTFRPGDNVRRGPMAAFMDRGFGAAATSVDLPISSVVNESDGVVQLGTIDVDVPGAGGTQYVQVTAQFDGAADIGCPCELAWAIGDVDSWDGFGFETFEHWHNGSVTWTFQAPSGLNVFDLAVVVVDGDATPGSEAVYIDYAQISAVTFPLSADPATVASASTSRSIPKDQLAQVAAEHFAR